MVTCTSRRRLCVVSALAAVVIAGCQSVTASSQAQRAGPPSDAVPAPEGMEYLGKNAQGCHEYRNVKDGSVMVLIPTGKFEMGKDRWGVGPRPHQVYLDAYLFGKTELTVGQFRQFVKETGYRTQAEASSGALEWTGSKWDDRTGANWRNPHFNQGDNHPVVCVSWNDAAAYCRWAGMRLPTEAEWERGARGTDARTWPWGNTWDGSRCNCADKNASFLGSEQNEDDGFAATAPVGSYPAGASPYGLLDMAGNAEEWCADWHDDKYYQKGENRNPRGPTSGIMRVMRGGSFAHTRGSALGTHRDCHTPSHGWSFTGFRCARDVK